MYNKKIPIDLDCGVKVALEVMGGKWKSYIIYRLQDGPMRPSEIHRAITGTSPRVIDQQLSELLDYGIVERKVFDTMPKCSKYCLTEFGRTLLPVISAMDAWGTTHKTKLLQAITERNELYT